MSDLLMPGAPLRARLRVLVAFALAWSSLVAATPAGAQPVPNCAVADVEQFLGEPGSFTASFTNTGGVGQVGYQPLVELFVPAELTISGISSPQSGVALNVAANLPVPPSGIVTNPITGEELSGLTPGLTYLVLQPPLGSFPPGQPPIDFIVSYDLANTVTPEVALADPITCVGMFALGTDALNNPTADPPVRNEFAAITIDPVPDLQGLATEATVTPILYRPEKSVAILNDDVTGPNYPMAYDLSVNVANTAVLTPVTLYEQIPDNLRFVGITGISVNGSTGNPTVTATFDAHPCGVGPITTLTGPNLLSATVYPLVHPAGLANATQSPNDVPGGCLEVTIDTVTGELGGGDAVITYEAYVPEFDVNASRLISSTDGGETVVSNTVTSSVDTATGGFGVISLVGADRTTDPVDQAMKSVDNDKSGLLLNDIGPAGVSSGDTVEWTINTATSDFFGHDTFAVADVLGDGLDFNNLAAGNPQLLTAQENGQSTPGLPINYVIGIVDPAPDLIGGGYPFPHPAAPLATLLVTENARPGEASGTSPGFTTMIFDISGLIGHQCDISGNPCQTTLDCPALETCIQDGNLDGGFVDTTSSATGFQAGIDDDTNWSIRYESTIQEEYENPASFTLDSSIDSNDALTNQADVAGIITSDPAGVLDVALENVSDALSVPQPQLVKELVAINGGVPPVPLQIEPNDDVTFSLRLTIPTGRVDDLILEDFLPLPVFLVDDPNADTVVEAWTFDNSVLAAATYPAAGEAAFGPNTDNLGPGVYVPTDNPPAILVDLPNNAISFDFPDEVSFDPATPVEITVEVLFTVRVNGEPLADRLFLTNRVQTETTNSVGDTTNLEDLVFFELRQPNLGITKGVSLAPQGTIDPLPAILPVDGDLVGADAGDVIRYTITVENTGGSEAYDVVIEDPEISEFAVGSCSLVSVELGDGTALSSPADYVGDLFSGGITLTGNLAASDGTAGAPFSTDTVIVVADCTLAADVESSTEAINTASITSFTSIPGWPQNFVDPGDTSAYSDPASVTMSDPTMAKVIDTVTPGAAVAGRVTGGDTITYEVAVTLPEGETNQVVLTDVLPAGFDFQFLSLTVDTAGPGFAGTVTGSPTVTQTGVITTGVTVEFDFGTVTTTDDNDPGTNTFLLRYDVLVDGLLAENDGLPAAQVKTNNIELDYQSNPNPPLTDSATTNFVEPDLTITKSMTPATAQGGDTVTVTLVVENDGTGRAYDVVVTDVLDPALFDLTALTSVNEVTTPADFVYNYDAFTGTVSWTIIPTNRIDAAGSRTFRFSANIRADVVTSSAYTNTADVDGDTQDGVVTGERTTDDDDDAPITIVNSGIVKSMIATSEDSTDPTDSNLGGNPPVAIGEVLTFQIVYTMPQGVTQEVRLADLLPTGLEYIPGSATLRRDSAALTAATNVGAGLGINGEIAGTDVPVTLTGTTGEVFIDLGDVTNLDTNSATGETYTLILDALVRNTITNNAGNVFRNRGRIRYRNVNGVAQLINSNQVRARAAEPVPEIAKAALPTTGEAGDTITFTVTISNTASGSNASNAFDWTFSDPLPTEYSSPLLVSIDTTGAPAAAVAAAFGGNVLSGTIDVLEPGEFVVLTYTADLNATAAFAGMVPNTVDASASSLPGTNGTGGANPNPAGDSNGERTGAGGVNDLAVSDSAIVNIDDPTISKTTLNSQAFYAIGEIATFEITVGLPGGTTNSLVVSDILPLGLEFVPGTVVVTPPAGFVGVNTPFTEANAAFFTEAGQDLEFDFGSVSTTGSSNLVIVYDALVTDIITNQDGTLLENLALLEFDDPDNPGTPISVGPVPTDIPVRVGEPNLDLAKLITAGATGSQAGDTVSWEVTVANTGNTTAFLTNWIDILPDGPALAPANDGIYAHSNATLLIAGGSVLVSSTQLPIVDGDFIVSTTNNPDDTLALPPFDIAPGASLTISFDSLVGDDAVLGQVFNNVATADYNSLPAGGGRDNATDPGNVDDDDDTDLDNYEESASQMLVLDAPLAIDKTVTPTIYTVGEDVTYTVTLSVGEGTTTTVVATDSLPAGLLFQSSSIAAGNMGMVFGNATYATPIIVGQDISFDFGDVSNPPDLNATNDFIEIEITARVENILANQDGTVLENNAFATSDAGANRVDFDSDGGTPGIQGLDIVVVEPDLLVSKTAMPTEQSLGDVVMFTVTVQHSGSSTADAYDLVLTDTIPAGLTYVPGSASVPVLDQNFVDPVLTITRSSLTLLDGTFVYTYLATIDADATPGVALTNTLDLEWASLPGANGDPDDGRTGSGGVNDYTTGDTADVTPDTDAFIDASKTVVLLSDLDGSGTVTPGDTLRYTVVLSNDVEAVTNVVFTDTLPSEVTYAPGTLASSQGLIDDSGAPTLSVDVGAMGVPSSVTINFSVTVNPGVPTGTVISNQGSVDSDQTVPEPTDEDGEDENGDQPTDVITGGIPVPQAELYVEKLVELLTDVDASSSVTPNDLLRYTLIFHNLGNQALTGVTLTDTIPTGLTGVGGSGTSTDGGATVTVLAGSVSVSGMSVGIGDTETVTFNTTVDSPLFDAGTDADLLRETFVNQGVADSNETDPVNTDSNGDPSDGNQPTDIEAVDGVPGAPDVDLEKRVSLASDLDGDGLVDPLDVLLYSIVLRNTGSADATAVQIVDNPIPNNVTIVAGSATTSQGLIVTESPLAVNVGTVPPGDVVTVTFRAEVTAGTANGTIIINQASVSGSNFPTEPSDDNGDDDDGLNPNLTPVDTGVPGGGGAGQPSFDKTVASSSEPTSAGSALQIGEVVTFQLAFSVPAGTTPQVSLTDTLPAGLIYVDDSTEIARVFDTGLVTSGNPGGVNTAASANFVALSDGSDVIVAGQDLSVAIGDVINSDLDAGDEQVLLRYDAIVQNVIGNQAGTLLANNAQANFWDGLSQPQALNDSEIVSVIEPNLAIDKAAAPAIVASLPDTVTFTLTVTNPAGVDSASAFNVQVLDTVPVEFSNVTITTITPSGGVSGITDNSAGSLVDITADVFPEDGQLEIEFTADLSAGLVSADIDNTATATGTSLPGTNGTGNANPNAPGSTNGERTGDGGVNDIADSDLETVMVILSADVLILKSDTIDPVFQGGATTYQIAVLNNGPEIALDVQVVDTLDPNMTFLTSSIFCTEAAGVVTCDIGALDPGELFTFEIAVQVDVAAPTAGTTQIGNCTVGGAGIDVCNTATVTTSADDPNLANNTDSEPTDVTPAALPAIDLSLTKTDVTDPVPVDGTVTYNLTVTNFSFVAGVDVYVTDFLDPNTTFVSDTAPGGCVETSPGRLECEIGGIAAFGSVGFQITVQVEPTATTGGTPSAGPCDGSENLCNTAFVASRTQSDTDPSGNSADEPTALVPSSVDLELVKSDNTDPVELGANLTYTIDVTNNGPSTALDVEVVDTLDANTSFISSTGACVEAPVGTLTCTIGTLANGAVSSFDVTVHVNGTASTGGDLGTDPCTGTPGTPGNEDVCNAATVSSSTTESDPSNNSDDEPTDVTVPAVLADLSLTKTDNVDPANQNGLLTYTLNVTNAGPDATTGVIVTDTLDANTSFVSTTLAGGCVEAPVGTLTCDVGALGVASTSFEITVLVDLAAPTAGTLQASPCTGAEDLCNLASVAGDHPDPDLTNNSDDEPTDVEPASADVSIAKSDAPDPISIGDSLTYTIDVTNAGPSTAEAVTVVDTLDANTSYVSDTGGCVEAPVGTLTCGLGDLAVGSTSFTITVNVDPGAPTAGALSAAPCDGSEDLCNTVTVSSTTPDPTPGNNSDDEPTDVQETADLAITKSDTPDPVVEGDFVLYTLTVENLGNDTATGVVVTDTLAAFTSYVSDTGGCVEAPVGTLTCALADLASGASTSFFVTVSVDAGAPTGGSLRDSPCDGSEDLCNLASVTADQVDPDPTNNSADEPTDVVIDGDAALQIVKRDSPDSVEPGGTLTYTLDYSNISLLPIDNVVIEEIYDPAVTFVTAVPFPDVGNAQWNIGTMAPGETGTITITVTVDPGALDGDVLVNNVSMSGDGVPPATDDEETTVSVPGPDTALLRVTKSVNPLSTPASGLLTYTFTVFNEGQATSYDTIVVDDLPVGTTYSNANPQPDSVAGNLLQWAIGDLAPGAGATFTVYALTDSTLPAGTLIENCAIATGMAGAGTVANSGLSAEGCAVSSSTGPGTDCTLVMKKRSVGVPVPGGDIVYRCLWCDPCADSNSVLISDFLPDEVTLVSVSTRDVDATTTIDGDVQLTIAQLPAGRAGLAHIRVRINDDVAPGTAITNTITMSDAALRQQSGTDVMIVRAGKEDVRRNGFIRVTGPKRVPDGGRVSYKAKFKNIEIGSTVSMVVSEQIDPVFIFPPADYINGNVVTWENIRRSSGTLLIKGQVNLSEPDAVGAILSAEVLATTPSQLQFKSGSDTAITNGPAAVVGGTTVSTKKLSVSVAAPRYLRTGLQTSISLRYRNLQGTGNAQMNLPDGLSFVSAIPEPTSVDGGVLTWSGLDRLSGTAKVRVLVDPTLGPNTILTIGGSITDDIGASGTETVVTTR